MHKATLTITVEQEAESFPIELDAEVPVTVTAQLVRTDESETAEPTVFNAPNALTAFRYLSDLGAGLAGETVIRATVSTFNAEKLIK